MLQLQYGVVQAVHGAWRGCAACYDDAIEAFTTGQAKGKVRVKRTAKGGCKSSECTITVEALNSNGYDYHCLPAATTEDIEESHQHTAGGEHNPGMCWDHVDGLDSGSAACSEHLGADTLRQMGAQARGHYKVSLEPGGGSGSNGIINSNGPDAGSETGS